jgi:DNA modification methylase
LGVLSLREDNRRLGVVGGVAVIVEGRMKPYYEHGGIQIFHGDCRDILPLLKADVVVTDPPYGVEIAEWDGPIPLRECQLRLETHLSIAPNVVWFGAAPPDRQLAILSLQPRPTRTYIWHNTFTLTNSDGAFWQWQPFYVWGRLRGLGKDVLSMTANNGSDSHVRLHPCQKPIPLMRSIVEATVEGTILDPFMGSGTTLVAAKQLGRKAIGIEIEERYCEIAAKRLAQEVFDFAPTPIPQADNDALCFESTA